MIHTAIEAAQEAGKILTTWLGKSINIEFKDERKVDLVTIADKQSEEKILEIIRRKYPKHEILAEESGKHSTDSDYKWIIDPLDGTTNFAHGLQLYSVSIALAYKEEIVAGVVYNPSTNEMYTAELGGGAFLNGKPIHVSSVDTVERGCLVTGFPYNVRENPDFCHERFIAFLQRVQALRRFGSAALDAAFLAAGRLDGFWEVALKPWDKAAGSLLITEAGGTISNFEGGPHDIYGPQFLASNGSIHAQMVEILHDATKLKIITS